MRAARDLFQCLFEIVDDQQEGFCAGLIVVRHGHIPARAFEDQAQGGVQFGGVLGPADATAVLGHDISDPRVGDLPADGIQDSRRVVPAVEDDRLVGPHAVCDPCGEAALALSAEAVDEDGPRRRVAEGAEDRLDQPPPADELVRAGDGDLAVVVQEGLVGPRGVLAVPAAVAAGQYTAAVGPQVQAGQVPVARALPPGGVLVGGDQVQPRLRDGRLQRRAVRKAMVEVAGELGGLPVSDAPAPAEHGPAALPDHRDGQRVGRAWAGGGLTRRKEHQTRQIPGQSPGKLVGGDGGRAAVVVLQEQVRLRIAAAVAGHVQHVRPFLGELLGQQVHRAALLDDHVHANAAGGPEDGRFLGLERQLRLPFRCGGHEDHRETILGRPRRLGRSANAAQGAKGHVRLQRQVPRVVGQQLPRRFQECLDVVPAGPGAGELDQQRRGVDLRDAAQPPLAAVQPREHLPAERQQALPNIPLAQGRAVRLGEAAQPRGVLVGDRP